MLIRPTDRDRSFFMASFCATQSSCLTSFAGFPSSYLFFFLPMIDVEYVE
jgi:hypothetical protein